MSISRDSNLISHPTAPRLSTVLRNAVLIVGLGLLCNQPHFGAEVELPNYRRPTNETELRFWLENMVWFHRFTTEEIISATGLSRDEIAAGLKKFSISASNRPKRP